MNNRTSDYEQQLNAEIDKRLCIMESADYIFPKRFGKRDYLITLTVVIICLILIIIGAFL